MLFKLKKRYFIKGALRSLVIGGTISALCQGQAMETPSFNINNLNWYSESDIPTEIPVLDLKYMSKKEQIDCIKKSSESAQCFYVKNHSISNKDTENLVNITRSFFTKPEAEKLKTKSSNREKLRGYNGYQQQSSAKVFDVANAGKGDSHISFYWGPDENKCPDLENFEKIWTTYFNKSYDLAKTLSELIIEALEFKATLNWEDINKGDNLLKLQDFIEEDEPSTQPFRIVPHADTSFITLLNQIPADNGYIALEAKIGEKFIGVPAVKDTLLVNFGEPMYSLSNGRFKPVIHQVVSPKENFKGSSRLSIPFFFEPNPEAIIYPYEGSTYKKYYNSDRPTLFSDFRQNLFSDLLK